MMTILKFDVEFDFVTKQAVIKYHTETRLVNTTTVVIRSWNHASSNPLTLHIPYCAMEMRFTEDITEEQMKENHESMLNVFSSTFSLPEHAFLNYAGLYPSMSSEQYMTFVKLRVDILKAEEDLRIKYIRLAELLK